ncbi:hypothetical protein [Candidatus Accumulibacter phosphatis]|uniref:GNAT family N-acetyltransferase n=1 Tax=Candidatus Accumulibacter phosphatis TaxID=327160 RepID=UPI0030135559
MNAAPDFALQPTLIGETIFLRPLQAGDFEPLYAAASDPAIWEQHPEPLRYQRAVFAGFFASALASGGALLAIEKTFRRGDRVVPLLRLESRGQGGNHRLYLPDP